MGTRPCRERSSRHREDEWSRSRGSAGFIIGTRGLRDRAPMGFSPPQVALPRVGGLHHRYARVA
jgi:hypothetical protein